jgi:hypothetical protein
MCEASKNIAKPKNRHSLPIGIADKLFLKYENKISNKI